MPTSSTVLLCPDQDGYRSHSNVDYLESIANGSGAAIEKDVDPKVFGQWFGNVREMRVEITGTSEYIGYTPSIPTKTVSDTKTYYRVNYDYTEWPFNYPPPFYIKTSAYALNTSLPNDVFAYDLMYPAYAMDTSGGGGGDITAVVPDVTFYVKDQQLRCAIFSYRDTYLDSFSLGEKEITVTSKRSYSSGVGTVSNTNVQTATITKKYY